MPRKPEVKGTINGLKVSEFMEKCEDRHFYFYNVVKIRPKRTVADDDVGQNDPLVPLRMREAQKHFMDTIDRLQREGTPPRIVILKARQIGFCCAPDTLVLTADLRWVRIDEVPVGEVLVGVDERVPGGRGAGRKMRPSVVEAKRTIRAKAIRIVTDNGTIVVTAEHRLLCRKRGGTEQEWREAGTMRVGDRLRMIAKPWGPASFEDGWFGGMIDGEGHLRVDRAGGAELCIAQLPGPVMDRAHTYLTSRDYPANLSLNGSGQGYGRRVAKVSTHRTNDIMRIVGQCRPTRYVNKQWWSGMELPGKRIGASVGTILSIEHLPAQEMVDIQTSTQTFVANGIVSHNSTVTGAEMFRRNHLRSHQQSLIIAHTTEAAQGLFANVQRIYEEMPALIRPAKKYATKRLLHFKENDSKMQVEAAGEVRGMTASMVHLSELAFVENAETLLTAVLQTVPDTPESLIVIESTANGIGNAFHRLWKRAVAPGSGWVALFYPWHGEATYRLPAKDWPRYLGVREIHPDESEAERMERLGFNIEQLAWWRYTLETKCLGDRDKMAQEYPDTPEEAFLHSGRPIMDKKGLAHYAEIIESREKEDLVPERYEISENLAMVSDPRLESVGVGRLHVYRKPQPRHPYIIAADLSEGDPGSDPSPTAVLDRTDLMLSAVWYGRAVPEQKAHIDHAIARWYNNAYWVWEANNHGILYGHEVVHVIQYPFVHYRRTSEDSVAGKVTDKYGFHTSGLNRENLFNVVRRFVSERAGVMLDRHMLDEWSALRYNDKTGRADHDGESYSDLTVAFGMALWIHAGAHDAKLIPMPAGEMAGLANGFMGMNAHMGQGEKPSLILPDGVTVGDIDRFFAEQERIARRDERLGGIARMR